jgi:ribosomal protein L31E
MPSDRRQHAISMFVDLMDDDLLAGIRWDRAEAAVDAIVALVEERAQARDRTEVELLRQERDLARDRADAAVRRLREHALRQADEEPDRG